MPGPEKTKASPGPSGNVGHVCQEKFACTGAQAVYECEECGTMQCENCEAQLHETAKFVFHDRRRMKQGEPGRCDLWCDPHNRAVLWCEQCKVNVCAACKKKQLVKCTRRNHKLVRLAPDEPPPVDPETVPRLDADGSSDEAEVLADALSSLPLPTLGEPPAFPAEGPGLIAASRDQVATLAPNVDVQSFLLVDEFEKLQVANEAEFLGKLGCDSKALVKVVSIFGNTGDGKSHTMNAAFFHGCQVFNTSYHQSSCTVGVWAAFDPATLTITVDTEGLLGVTSNQNQRTRLLLKVLAISDVIIYRTRADRLHNDLFRFLGDASCAYQQHFTQELRAVSDRCKMDVPLSTLGPSVLIFHETQHTEVLGADQSLDCHGKPSKTPEMLLKERFKELKLHPDAFSSIEYIGTRTKTPPTDFKGLQSAVKKHLSNGTVRSPRAPAVIFHALKVLNEKFSGDIERSVPSTFPDAYFTCGSICMSCSARCSLSMSHEKEDIPHKSGDRCQYQHQYDNRIYTCKECFHNGKEVVVVPKVAAASDSTWFGLAKYAWSGYVLECPNHGIIYRSRQYWYGNTDPVDSAVRTEIRHVWPGGARVLQGTHNAARRLIDGVHHVAGTVGELSAKPSKMLGSWVADQIAPAYWVPNARITKCQGCKHEFEPTETKHHCRACGQGFCDECSSRQLPVPERGWGEALVRVCESCFKERTQADGFIPHLATDLGDPHVSEGTEVIPAEEGEGGADKTVMVRKVGEVMQSTLGVAATAINYPLGLMVDAARPAYWVADSEIVLCHGCQLEFDPTLSKHHCRACGNGFCDECSMARRPVPSRGWDHPVRVCNECNRKSGDL
ncbi:zinc finger FYVE domain-containing protein 1-like isoform X1 [Branchiostoma lanceolatum]|uniref:zinc finger FYVE domain-containing protein 1-like isoform X1 n=1 Tax=Branchiostoma lanceolatum TaxID=7740 RepID=UPI0034572446